MPEFKDPAKSRIEGDIHTLSIDWKTNVENQWSRLEESVAFKWPHYPRQPTALTQPMAFHRTRASNFKAYTETQDPKEPSQSWEPAELKEAGSLTPDCTAMVTLAVWRRGGSGHADQRAGRGAQNKPARSWPTGLQRRWRDRAVGKTVSSVSGAAQSGQPRVRGWNQHALQHPAYKNKLDGSKN